MTNIEEAVPKLIARGLKLAKGLHDEPNIMGMKTVHFKGENAFGVEIELVQYDVARSIAACHLGLNPSFPRYISRKQ